MNDSTATPGDRHPAGAVPRSGGNFQHWQDATGKRWHAINQAGRGHPADPAHMFQVVDMPCDCKEKPTRTRRGRRAMPRKKPTRGGRRPNAGRPSSTGMASTPPIHYRVSAAQYAELKAEGRASKPRLTPNAVAKARAFPVVPLGEPDDAP